MIAKSADAPKPATKSLSLVEIKAKFKVSESEDHAILQVAWPPLNKGRKAADDN